MFTRDRWQGTATSLQHWTERQASSVGMMVSWPFTLRVDRRAMIDTRCRRVDPRAASEVEDKAKRTNGGRSAAEKRKGAGRALGLPRQD